MSSEISEEPNETKQIKLAIIGGRDFQDYELVKATVAKVKSEIVAIVSGGAKGADSLAERYAREHGIPVEVYPADWNKHGRRAGFLRNQDIISACDAVIAFWDGVSAGTRSSIEIADKAGKSVHIEGYDNSDPTALAPVAETKPNPYYQRVRTDAEGRRFLQCHSKGAKEYSPFFCYVNALGIYQTIEDHYQSTKLFINKRHELYQAQNWRDAKGYQRNEDNVLAAYVLPNGLDLGKSNSKVTDLVIQWYIALWHKFLRANPELVTAAQGYDGYEDIFEGKFPFSQAKVMAQVCKEGVESLYPMYAELRELLKTEKAAN